MCVRYNTIDERFERWLRRKNIWVPIMPPKEKDANLFPGGQAFIIRPDLEHGLELAPAQWGLLPKRARLASIGKRYGYNARQEGSEDNPIGIENMTMFKEPFRNRRCLVPATAFFERVGPKGAQRWMKIQPDDEGEPLLMLGIWNHAFEWTEIPTFSIVTTEPPENYIHDRIPVLVDEERGRAWMSDGAPIAGLKALTEVALADSLVIEDFGPVEYKPKKEKPVKAPKPPKLTSAKPKQEELF